MSARIAATKDCLGGVAKEAFTLEGDYETRLIYRAELQSLVTQIRNIIDGIDQTIIEEMELAGKKKDETISFEIEWHPKSRTVWDKEKLEGFVRMNNIPGDRVVSLLNKGFALSKKGLKNLGMEYLENACETIYDEDEKKNLVVRMKKQ